MTSYAITYNNQIGGFWFFGKNKDKTPESKVSPKKSSPTARTSSPTPSSSSPTARTSSPTARTSSPTARTSSPTPSSSSPTQRTSSPTQRTSSPKATLSIAARAQQMKEKIVKSRESSHRSSSPKSSSPKSSSPRSSPKSSSPRSYQIPVNTTNTNIVKDISALRALSEEQKKKDVEEERKRLVTENLHHLEDLFSFNFESPSRSGWEIKENNLTYQKRDAVSNRKERVSIDKNIIIDEIKRIHKNINNKGNQEERDQAIAILQTFRKNYNRTIKTYLEHTKDHSLDNYFIVLVRLITYAAHYEKDLKSNMAILDKYVKETDKIKALSLLMKILLTDIPKDERNRILTTTGLSNVL